MSFEQTQTIEKSKEEKLVELKEKAAELFAKKMSLLNDNPSATSTNDSLLDSYQKELNSTLDQIAVLEAEEIIEEKQKSDLESRVEKKPMTEMEAENFFHQDKLDKLTKKEPEIAEYEQKRNEALEKLSTTKDNGERTVLQHLISEWDKQINPYNESVSGHKKALEALKSAKKLTLEKEKGLNS